VDCFGFGALFWVLLFCVGFGVGFAVVVDAFWLALITCDASWFV
jgi:hypothetical protein